MIKCKYCENLKEASINGVPYCKKHYRVIKIRSDPVFAEKLKKQRKEYDKNYLSTPENREKRNKKAREYQTKKREYYKKQRLNNQKNKEKKELIKIIKEYFRGK